MMATRAMETATPNDAELVAATLSGNRDAFGQIVARYQSLVCALAYSATGSLSQSEDLAQETFFTAWKQLRSLREPGRLRSWLCGIARNLINNWLRRQGREPSHAAEVLDSVAESPTPEPLPIEQTMSREEEAILWRSLERIPEIYREPLVLFYREGESVARVAAALELSEDAVKQRLSRGRKLLHEQVLAVVEGTLRQTAPGKAFTLSVIAALPLLATSATAAAAVATAKGSVTAKTATTMGILGAILTAGFILTFSALGFLMFLGGCIGYVMSRAGERSPSQREHVIRFWRTLAIGFPVFVAIPTLWYLCQPATAPSHPWLCQTMTLWLGVIHPLILAALAAWIWRWRRGLVRPETDASEPVPAQNKRLITWLLLGMIVPACFFVASGCGWLSGSTLTKKTLSTEEVRKILSERKDAKVTVWQFENGMKALDILLPEKPHVIFRQRADEASLALLAEQKIAHETRIQGRDFKGGSFQGFAMQFAFLGLLSFPIVTAGGVILLRRPWKRVFYRQERDIGQTAKKETRAFKAFAACIALALGVTAALFALLTPWTLQTISAAEAPKIISDYKAARFTVVQLSNGTKELQMDLPCRFGLMARPDFVLPADEPTLSLLAQKGIVCKSLIQGQDFGYTHPSRAAALFLITLLAAVAGALLWWAVPRTFAVCAALVMVGIGILLYFITPWHTRTLSGAEVRTVVTEGRKARFEVFQFKNGSRQLWITLRGSRRYPDFIAPVDDPTLTLLARNGIAWKPSVQGLDFGIGTPLRGTSAWCIALLAAGAVTLPWWAVKRKRRLPAPTQAAA
jgi:RNA polymerase sigma factor (sigma-70 family)